MKKYLMIIAITIFLASTIQIVEDKLEWYDWGTSCYGEKCTDPEPMIGDWGYSSNYCKYWIIERLGNMWVKIPPPCNV